MLGYIGIAFLILAYISWLLTDNREIFLAINITGGLFFILHSIKIKDIPFIVVNVMIVLLQISKLLL